MPGPSKIASQFHIITGNNRYLRSNRISVRRARDYPMFSVPLLLGPLLLPAFQ